MGKLDIHCDGRFHVTVLGNHGREGLHASFDSEDDAVIEMRRLREEELDDSEESYLYKDGEMLLCI